MTQQTMVDDINKNAEIYQKNYWERGDLEKRRPPQHPVIAAYVIPRINLLRHYVDLAQHTRLLDVGCGNGFFTFYFDKICDAYGIDYSMKMLRINPVQNIFLMDANNLVFEDNSFDVVFANALLHHVKDIDKVIQEMVRVSKRNVIILDANRNHPLLFLFSLLVKEERKALKFLLANLRDRLSRNGLRVINAFSYGVMPPNKTPTFLFPLMRCSNFKQMFLCPQMTVGIKFAVTKEKRRNFLW